MKHDIWGEVGQSDSQPFDAVATTRHGSRAIKVRITRDDQPLETALNLAAEVVRRLAELGTAQARASELAATLRSVIEELARPIICTILVRQV
jgi:hypothetical protein